MTETYCSDASGTFARPRSLSEALDLLPSRSWTVLAGGTDVYPNLGERAPMAPMLDLTAIAGLDRISRDGNHWHIGALATWSDLAATDLPPAFDALKLAGRELGSIQIQNRATVIGNICNASPAADGVPPLLVLDAEVALTSRQTTRYLPLPDFTLGNRRTARRFDEIVTGVRIPIDSTAGRSSFRKLGSRRFLVISIVMTSARLATDPEGRIADAAIAVGACSAVAMRLPRLETLLRGRRLGDDLPLPPDFLADLSPIDDVRAGANYRLEAAAELVARTLRDCQNTGAVP